MTNAAEKLLPCAHCKGKARMRDVETDECSGFVYYVQCTNCKASSGLYSSKEQAIAAWNRLVAEKPKWTMETPTEEGWYMVLRFYGDPRAMPVRVMFTGGESVKTFNGHLYNLSTFCEMYPDIQWLKIDIPALPEEGEIA